MQATQIRLEQQISASDIPNILDQFTDHIKILSLDCFDTLLWRQTATPKDVFYAMAEKPLWQALQITAHQRIAAAERAYRHQFIEHGNHVIFLRDIYQHFPHLTSQEKASLIEEELVTEMNLLYALPVMLDLIRAAKARGLSVIITSDTYFSELELRRLLKYCLPTDIFNMIDQVFCSCEFNRAKMDGLFPIVIAKCSQPAHQILHIGDHVEADYAVPKQIGLHALHLLHHDTRLNDIVRLQNNAAALACLTNPHHGLTRPARYNPFRGVVALSSLSAEKPESTIGYLTFGPMLFAFAQFICDDIKSLQAAGKNPKVFFLLRDAYLLYRACEAYAGHPIGQLVHLRKFVCVAASFRTKEDVKRYLVCLGTQHYNFWVICEQLLLPLEMTQRLIQHALNSIEPEKVFNQLILQEETLKIVFQHSAAYRSRLLKYLQNEMNLTSGDTVILVDTGYAGVTQTHLTMALANEIDVTLMGRYFIASHEPDRPDCKALITSTACDHGLFEQCCTFKEGAVLDYSEDGKPIFDKIKLSDQQYQKVQAIQDECIRFIKTAAQFFQKAGFVSDPNVLKSTAMAALRRHVHFPTMAEMNYFHHFQHDKDMGATGQKTMYHIPDGLQQLKESISHAQIHPYIARTANWDFAVSSMLTKFFDLTVLPEDQSFHQEVLPIQLANDEQSIQTLLTALPTYHGYYLLSMPALQNTIISIQFGKVYQWLQVESVKFIQPNTSLAENIVNKTVFNLMMQKGNMLFDCQSEKSSMIIKPFQFVQQNGSAYQIQILFRPILKRV